MQLMINATYDQCNNTRKWKCVNYFIKKKLSAVFLQPYHWA